MDCAPKEQELQRLCLSCGLCCNGVLFRDVKLQATDRVQTLQKMGIPVQLNGRKAKFNQPCAALSNCACEIYDNRPVHCRTFECLLYKSVRVGDVTPAQALKTVKKARLAVVEVERILNELGDRNTHLPLRTRFQRQMKGNDKAAADSLAHLSVAMHQLTVVLSCSFYD